MKKIYTLAIAVLSLLTIACSKNDYFEVEQPEEAVIETEIYGLPLRFEADATVTEATVAVYDKDFVQIAVENIVLPESDSEVYEMVFVSETNPEYIYTPGLENGDPETGYLHVGGQQVRTKGSSEDGTILLVIKR